MKSLDPRSPRALAEYALFRIVRRALSILDDAEAAEFGAWLGRTVSRLARRRHELLISNLAQGLAGLGADRRDEIARACWEHFGRVAIDYLRFEPLSAAELRARITITGEDHFQSARLRGRGVFLLSAHLGSWEVGALVAGMLGEPISLIVRPLDNPLLEAELLRFRSRYGNRVIAKRDAAREMLRAMRHGETVAILVDQKVQPEEAVVVPFFGRPARTTPALARLAARTDAAVVPVFCRPDDRRGHGFYQLEFGKPIIVSELPIAEREVEPLTERYMSITENAIRARPELWLWMHDRWRAAK